VNAPATGTLREAMAEAADRDRIARQYVTTYEDIFSLGLPALATARRRQSDARWSTLAVYLTFLAAMPDTHIARKFGLGVAEAVRREAADWRDALTAAPDPEGIADRLLTWDAALKSRGINPGTSADLTVATLFAASLSSLRGDKCAAAILPLRANDA
jgi:triphosphoribosyl-dephospho-CoA synthase